MSSKSARKPLIRSFRVRTIVWITLLFFALYAICVFSVWFVERRVSLREEEADLTFQFQEFHAEYVLGEEYCGSKEFLPPSSAPSPVAFAVRHRWPDAQIITCAKDEEGVYDICLADGPEKGVLLRVDRNGVLLEERVARPDDRIARIHEQFNEEYHGVGYSHVFNFLLSEDGSQLLAHSRVSPDILPLLTALCKTVPRNRFCMVSAGEETYRVRCAPTFDGRLFFFGARVDTKRDERFLMLALGSLLLILVAANLLARFLSNKLVAGILRVSVAAREIQAGQYSKRVEHGQEGEEIDMLIDSFNGMVAHTENVITELRTITDNIAHDLKTPITRLRGMAEFALLHGNPAAVSLAEDVAEECSGMLSMINTMLDITRTECDVDRCPRGVVNLTAEANRAAELFAAVVSDSGVELQTAVDGDAYLSNGYVQQIRRLFANLLDNAIKFTPKGGRIRLDVTRVGSGREAGCRIRVSDTGCGIPKEDLPHVFDRFYRSDKSRAVPGNGLGLSLVRAIVSAHGGSIAIESEEGEGTTVSILLPVVFAVASTAAAQEKE